MKATYFLQESSKKIKQKEERFDKEIEKLIEEEKRNTKYHFSSIGWINERQTKKEFGLLLRDNLAVMFSPTLIFDSLHYDYTPLNYEKGYYQLSPHQSLPGKYVLDFYDCNEVIHQFIIESDTCDEIIKHFKTYEINQEKKVQEDKSKLKIFYERCESLIHNISNNKRVMTLFENFIDQYDYRFLLLPSNFSSFFANVHQVLDHYIQHEETILFDNPFEDQFPFLKFCNLIQTKECITEVESLYICWTLVNELLSSTLFSSFQKEYVSDWEEDLDGQIKNYFKIPTINVDDRIQIGKFVRYLIKKFIMTWRNIPHSITLF
jgi:hypothetical protein